MKIEYFKGRISASLLILIASVFISTNALANLKGRWIQHPAACLRSEDKESQVDRILEGERYVYFVVRGSYFNRDNSYFYNTAKEIDPIQIFRYDKTLPWSSENIRPLAQEFELSGSLPVVINYSTDKRILVVIYENGGMDFVYDDGTIVSSAALKNATMPTMNAKAYTVTFDDENSLVYIAGTFGYIVVDASNGELAEIHKLNKAVSWAGRVGDNMVVFAGDISSRNYNTNTYIFPIGEKSSSLPAPVSGGENLQYLMPLAGNTFAAMAPGASDTQYNLKVFSIGEEVRGGILEANCNVDNAALPKYRHMFRTDGFAAAMKGGYAIQNNSNVILLKKGLEYNPEGAIDAYKDMAVTLLSKSGLETANERNSKAQTYDGKRLWLYTYENAGNANSSARGFYYKDFDSSAWSTKSDIYAPNAPTSTFAAYSLWDSTNGLLMRGPGAYFATDAAGMDFLSSYKNNRWKDLSFGANYNERNYHNITTAGKYIGVDPLNSNWIWGVSTLRGLFRMDLEDYSNYIQFGTSYKGYQNSYKGYFDCFSYQMSYRSLISFTNVDFDNRGTLWTSRMWYYEGDDDDEITEASEAYNPLIYITAEDRHAFNPDMNNSQLSIHELHVPGVSSTSNSSIVIALKSPGSENYIAYSSRYYTTNGKFYVFDHNGTLDNTDDDRVAVVDCLYDENGDRIGVMLERGLFEDQSTGDLWYCTSSGPFLINPSEFLAGNKKARRLHFTKKEGIEDNGNPLEHIAINFICADKFGRKWLSTESGLYCVSADNKELLGHYTVENSSLPSDYVVSVACDLETGSVFALTVRGMAEFQPEDCFNSIPEGNHLTIWPSSVTPEYKGYININGVESGSSYVICNADGDIVKRLGGSETGKLQWDGNDADGQRVAPGRYNIQRENKDETNSIIVL